MEEVPMTFDNNRGGALARALNPSRLPSRTPKHRYRASHFRSRAHFARIDFSKTPANDSRKRRSQKTLLNRLLFFACVFA
ncbi:MAG: hypothetical protein ACI8W7_004779 [Gammaproteobacteria bacterium]|jgi:hypothetical protein